MQGRDGYAVLAHRGRAHAELAQEPVRGAAERRGLAPHQHVRAGVVDLVLVAAADQADVAGQPVLPGAGENVVRR